MSENMLNHYYDLYLDKRGVDLLEQIINISQTDTERAIALIDVLITEYPNSPQLLISKSLFLPVKTVQPLIQIYMQASQVDAGFYDTYRRWSNCVMISAFQWDYPLTTERMKYTHHWMALKYFMINHQIVEAISYVEAHPEIISSSWVNEYEEALEIRRTGVKNCYSSPSRYPMSEIVKSLEENERLETVDVTYRLANILITWMRVMASRKYNVPE